jgi:hypothetical protein
MAGKAAGCEGCPNQEACATAPKGPDPGAASCPRLPRCSNYAHASAGTRRQAATEDCLYIAAPTAADNHTIWSMSLGLGGGGLGGRLSGSSYELCF